MTKLVFDFIRGSDSIRDLLPQQFSVAAAQSLHGHLESAFRSSPTCRQLRISGRRLLTREENLQFLKLLQPAGDGGFLAQTTEHGLQQRGSPALLLQFLRRPCQLQVLHNTPLETPILKRLEQETPAAFDCFGAMPFIGQKMIQRHEEEGSEPASVTVCLRQPSAIQQPPEEFLGQVLSVPS
jgi:hypothetical protein